MIIFYLNCIGTWADIQTKKAIVCEPKFSDKLDEVMKEFYDAVEVNAGRL